MVVQTWAENNESSTPTADELKAWGENYGHTFPDVADAGWALNNKFEKDGGIPTQILIAPGGEIVKVDQGYTAADIEAILPR